MCEHIWLLGELLGENSDRLLLPGIFVWGVLTHVLLGNGFTDVADGLIGDIVVWRLVYELSTGGFGVYMRR